uniref:Putative secreted protein n=1 Tax=Anopheles marajoara TaxID=58244 RepID=A0A2M4CFU0_9DIPT
MIRLLLLLLLHQLLFLQCFGIIDQMVYQAEYLEFTAGRRSLTVRADHVDEGEPCVPARLLVRIVVHDVH